MAKIINKEEKREGKKEWKNPGTFHKITKKTVDKSAQKNKKKEKNAE